MPDVSLDDGNKDLVLDLIARLRSTCVGEEQPAPKPASKTSSVKPKDPEAVLEWRAQRAAEARLEEKAKRKEAKAKQEMLKDMFKADAAATLSARQQQEERQQHAELPTTGSVRVTLVSSDKPSDKKLVVLQRAPHIEELLKVGKAKLKMKRALGARLLDTGAPVRSTAALADSCVVAVCADAQQDEEIRPATSPEKAETAKTAKTAKTTEEVVRAAQEAPAATTPTKGSAPSPSAPSTAACGDGEDEEEKEKEKEKDGVASSRKRGTVAHPRRSALPRVLLPQRLASSEEEQRQLEAALSLSRSRASPAPMEMAASRASLPVATHREVLLRSVADHAATIVLGEPGCGKSTQLPQYLLEEAISNGDACSCAIVVTQPRRVSAISLALRVAEERGEAVGEVVGYAVRGEVRCGPRCRLLYCTTGWLLRQLAGCIARGSPASGEAAAPSGEAAAPSGEAAAAASGDGGGGGGAKEDGPRPRLRSAGWQRLHRLSHVVVDEAHERSMHSDMLLTLLRRVVGTSSARERGTGRSGGGGGGMGPLIISPRRASSPCRPPSTPTSSPPSLTVRRWSMCRGAPSR